MEGNVCMEMENSNGFGDFGIVDTSKVVTVEIVGPRLDEFCDDKLYHWLLKWISKNVQLTLTNCESKGGHKQGDDGVSKRLSHFPGFNVVIPFNYKNQSFSLTRISTPEVHCHGVTYEKIVISTSIEHRHLVDDLLQECIPPPPVEEKEEDTTTIYVPEGTYWDRIGKPKKIRPMASVIMGEDAKTKLIGDIKEFETCEEWYTTRGIPYRRGYLLYGPPGCGKSSLIRAVAGEMKSNICILSLTAKGLTDKDLNALMNNCPDDAIIVLEDVDAAFTSREGKTPDQESFGDNPSQVTFAGLLNALDGVASAEGGVVFMTTNHIGRLDPALIRPGRVDMKLLIDYPNDDQLEKIFERFYPETEKELTTEFVKRLREFGGMKVSMAAAQGLFMFYKMDAQSAVDGVQEYFKSQILVGGTMAATENARGVFN